MIKTKQASKAPKHQWLGVVFYLGAMIWAHGATQDEAAVACAKRAQRDLRPYLKRGAKPVWLVNLYEVHDQDWSYDQDTGITLADGTRAQVEAKMGLQA